MPAVRGVLLTVVVVLVAIGIGVAVESPGAGKSAPAAKSGLIFLRRPAIRVTSTSRCPAQVAGINDVENERAQVLARLVPEDPTAALICRYGKVPSTATAPPYVLVRSRMLDEAEARDLARALDAVRLGMPRGATACPAAFAAASVVVFGFRFKPAVDIWYNDSGCQSLDNGLLSASEIGNTPFFTGVIPLIDRLAPRP